MTSDEKDHKTFSGKNFDEVDHFVNNQGLFIHYHTWKPVCDVKFLLGCIHGFGGQCLRFDELASHVTAIGGLVYALDQIGHGESEGSRTTVDDFNYFVTDVVQLTEKMKGEYPDVPVFLYGQSMGGALAVITACENPKMFSGIITVGGMFVKDPALSSTFMKYLLRTISAVTPNLTVSNLSDATSTRDKEEARISTSDPLKSGVVKAQMAYQLIRIGERVQEVMPSLAVPFLAIHGGADTTCTPEGSKQLHRVAKSSDKTLKIYDDCCHDVIHEIQADREICFKDIQDWLKNRL